jgi:hypothetical protein
MFEKSKSEVARSNFIFGTIAAAVISSGDLINAQERTITPESSIIFSQLTESEISKLPVNESLYTYADSFYVPVAKGHSWEEVIEKAWDDGLTGAHKIALVDSAGAAIFVKEFVRHSVGECILSFKDFNPEAGIVQLYSKTPEICTLDGFYFDKQALMS